MVVSREVEDEFRIEVDDDCKQGCRHVDDGEIRNELLRIHNRCHGEDTKADREECKSRDNVETRNDHEEELEHTDRSELESVTSENHRPRPRSLDMSFREPGRERDERNLGCEHKRESDETESLCRNAKHVGIEQCVDTDRGD